MLQCIFQTNGYGYGGSHDDDEASGENHSINLHSKGLIFLKIWCLIILLVSPLVVLHVEFLLRFTGGTKAFFSWDLNFLVEFS